jgi:leucyl-tRNA synthetase
MELKNALRAGRHDAALVASETWSEAIETLLVLLAPIAPFVAEELWERSGRRTVRGSVHRQAWPTFDKAFLARAEVELPVQINGKLRDKITVPAGTSEDDVKKLVLASAKVQQWIQGKEIAKFIFVKDRMVSLALRG